MAFDFEQLTVAEAKVAYDFTPTPNGYSEWGAVMLAAWDLCEYPGVEYVDALGLYLAERAAEIEDRERRKAQVLEVAAGRGMLSHYLNDRLRSLGSEVVIAASDGNAEVGSFFIKPLPHVKQQDHVASLRENQPDIVLGAWLPYDLTPAFRHAGVDEYILIGRPEGHGFHAGHSAWGRDEQGNPITPAYATDGYARTHIEAWQQYQLSQQSTTLEMHTSETHSFRRG